MKPDPDIEHFNRCLRNTAPGQALRVAVIERQLALNQLEAELERRQPDPDRLEKLRRAYIAASNVQSYAIQNLIDRCDWPPDSRAAFNYRWAPIPGWLLRRPPATPR